MRPTPQTKPRQVTVAATQFACTWDLHENLATAERLVRKAAGAGAQIIALPELFETPYFCQSLDDEYFSLAAPIDENPAVQLGRDLAHELQIVLPVSTFERDGQKYFNSVTIIDADGTILGTYRKTHIPEGPGYHEKFYFNPGDTGLRTWRTRYATIGVGICWDQWFVESARIMALQGAELLLYPTAIGSSPTANDDHGDHSTEPGDLQNTELRHTHWQTVQRGHAAANMMPIVAANRIGVETQGTTHIEFFGQSFITNQRGEVVEELSNDSEGVILHEFDLEKVRTQRASWGLFRDRRPSAYTDLTAGSYPPSNRTTTPPPQRNHASVSSSAS
ncbi:N-carbamoylputrescine amidase [Rhodococcus opacus]|uniref:N-carbamoylputrescine amidase n=1 Tax=Rhodococcus opacus TaxID=37919 RepID=UPI00055A458C|nr:N-carbamoylputrescine amidase [Rhodococcus sp. SC4]KXX59992.1 N-carbamoylputrescine amidase [Rhodococcus sp. LB1]